MQHMLKVTKRIYFGKLLMRSVYSNREYKVSEQQPISSMVITAGKTYATQKKALELNPRTN